ncbi:MAG: hypothetical protein KKG60_04140 [Nanoarchaeota archaeon]|nr:hypothetical protein [Nanoarchaeota archaeon]
MKLVVDSNVLFTFFWKNSVFRDILVKGGIILFSPELALKEIEKYRKEIIEKAKISQQDFKEIKKELKKNVAFIPLEEYTDSIGTARQIENDFSKQEVGDFLDDLDFFALAYELRCPLWSNDKLLKKQNKIPVFTTREIIILLN